MSEQKEINVISLFDGMSCGQIALKELGIRIGNYYASEIDKFAIQQTQHNFPSTIQLGDITQWRTWNIDWKSINLVLAGSPCQGFSFAGKQLAFDDPRSKLFFVFVDILNHIRELNPDVLFLLENVNMKKEHMRVINEYMGVIPVNINSALLSAQNRNRWYWTNIRTKQIGLFDEVHTDIPQPIDRGILLRDVLESEVDEKYYLSEKAMTLLGDNLIEKSINNQKSTTLDASYHKGVGIRNGGCRQVISDDQIIQKPRGKNSGGIHQQKSPTLSSNSWEQNNLVIQLNQNSESGGVQPYQQKRVYADCGKMICLDTDRRKNVFTNKRIRRLTPIEFARLQTIPEWYEWIVSDTQIYKMCGNGWTIEPIKHIFSFLENKLQFA